MSVEERIDRLERENRRLKLAGGGLVAAALIVVLAGAATTQQPDTIEVKGLILKDDDGKKLGELTSDERGTGIVFYDSEGETRAMFGVLPNGGGALNVSNSESNSGILPTGWGVRKDGKLVVGAGLGPSGAGFVVNKGNVSTSVAASGVYISDEARKTGMNIQVKTGDSDNPGITVRNADGTKRKL
jgi:hypothetical protein